VHILLLLLLHVHIILFTICSNRCNHSAIMGMLRKHFSLITYKYSMYVRPTVSRIDLKKFKSDAKVFNLMPVSVNKAPVVSSIIFKNDYSFIQFSYQYGHALLCTAMHIFHCSSNSFQCSLYHRSKQLTSSLWIKGRENQSEIALGIPCLCEELNTF
jgi:hypothetical protein